MNLSAISPTSHKGQDFNALQSALQTGNLAGAQNAFAAFLQDAQKAAATSGPHGPFAPGTVASKDLQALGGALKASDLAGARQAFSSLSRDLQMLTKTRPAQAHHHLTPQEVANNGVAATPLTAGSVSKILDSHG